MSLITACVVLKDKPNLEKLIRGACVGALK